MISFTIFHALKFDMHMAKTPSGHFYCERITEIIPVEDDKKPYKLVNIMDRDFMNMGKRSITCSHLRAGMSLTKEKRFFFQKKTRDTSPSTTVKKSS